MSPQVRQGIAVAVFLVISLVLAMMWPPSVQEIVWGVILVIWVLLMIYKASKPVARRWNKYIARKFIHFTTGGLVAVLAPFIFEKPTVPVVGAAGMALLTILPRLRGEVMDWYQVEGNYGDTWFCVSFGLLFLIFWYVDVWIAVLSAVFMAYGDGVTGIVRSVVYKRWVKGFWGSVAMAALSIPTGFLVKGLPGLIAGAVATVVEVFPKVDDNITVPFASAAVLYLFHALQVL